MKKIFYSMLVNINSISVRVVLIISMAFMPFYGIAQIGNPYYNPNYDPNHNSRTCSGRAECHVCFGRGFYYGSRCMTCRGTGRVDCLKCYYQKAYERLSKENAERNRIRAEQKAELERKRAEQKRMEHWNNARAIFSDGNQALMIKSYSDALKYYERAVELGEPDAYLMLGNMYELGFGVNANTGTAMLYYKLYDKKCRASDKEVARAILERINKDGFMEPSESNREKAIQSIKDYYDWLKAKSYQMSEQIVNGTNWDNPSISGSSSGSRIQPQNHKTSCVQCYGTGNCSICHGSGWMDLIYTGNQKLCTICNGTGKCRSCRGSGLQ